MDARQKTQLDSDAYALADAYRAGGRPDLKALDWTAAWARMLDELAKGRPGFARADYERALNAAFADSR